MHFNKLNGMETKEEIKNSKRKRKIREIQKVKIWNIWGRINEIYDEKEIDEEELKIIRENWKVDREKNDSNEKKQKE